MKNNKPYLVELAGIGKFEVMPSTDDTRTLTLQAYPVRDAYVDRAKAVIEAKRKRADSAPIGRGDYIADLIAAASPREQKNGEWYPGSPLAHCVLDRLHTELPMKGIDTPAAISRYIDGRRNSARLPRPAPLREGIERDHLIVVGMDWLEDAKGFRGVKKRAGIVADVLGHVGVRGAKMSSENVEKIYRVARGDAEERLQEKSLRQQERSLLALYNLSEKDPDKISFAEYRARVACCDPAKPVDNVVSLSATRAGCHKPVRRKP